MAIFILLIISFGIALTAGEKIVRSIGEKLYGNWAYINYIHRAVTGAAAFSLGGAIGGSTGGAIAGATFGGIGNVFWGGAEGVFGSIILCAMYGACIGGCIGIMAGGVYGFIYGSTDGKVK